LKENKKKGNKTNRGDDGVYFSIGRQRRTMILLLFAGVIAVTAAMIFAANITKSLAVNVGNSSNSIHRFNGNHHAPFISLIDYKPIYDSHNPNYMLVDVRPPGERAKSHIPGDIWVPLVDANYTGWQFLQKYKDKILFLYCACPWAEAAYESAILEQHGWNDSKLRVLHEGLPGWVQAGYTTIPDQNVCVGSEYWPKACDNYPHLQR
jgi:rhodanese-related sulfurtransferase